jgi:hypothetical protein
VPVLAIQAAMAHTPTRKHRRLIHIQAGRFLTIIHSLIFHLGDQMTVDAFDILNGRQVCAVFPTANQTAFQFTDGSIFNVFESLDDPNQFIGLVFDCARINNRGYIVFSFHDSDKSFALNTKNILEIGILKQESTPKLIIFSSHDI